MPAVAAGAAAAAGAVAASGAVTAMNAMRMTTGQEAGQCILVDGERFCRIPERPDAHQDLGVVMLIMTVIFLYVILLIWFAERRGWSDWAIPFGLLAPMTPAALVLLFGGFP